MVFIDVVITHDKQFDKPRNASVQMCTMMSMKLLRIHIKHDRIDNCLEGNNIT